MKTPRKRRSRGEVSKPSIEDLLLMAMERLIEKNQSFATVTVNQLAKEAGIARATFYLHFADKAELVAVLMNRLTDELVGSAGVWFHPTEKKLTPETLKVALTGIFKTFKKHQAIVEAITTTAVHDETVAQLYAEMMEKLCEQSRLSVQAIQGSQLKGNVSHDMLADVLTWSVELFCARFISSYDDKELEKLIDTFTHICLRSMFPSS